jgi:outer membrane biosynthesis protein TonB
MNQRNETVRVILGYLFAFFVVGACLWFLYQAYLNPDTASLPDTVSGMIVGGLLVLIQGAATFVFGQAIMQAASRASATATQAGVNAALTQPPGPTVTVDAGPPASATVTPAEQTPPEPQP